MAPAAPLNLAQTPVILGGDPAPNVIVSVDNSGSMGDAGIASLKAALSQTFSQANIPDNRIRLAWQAMHGCRGFDSSGNCNNAMARLSSTHRANFMAWVNALQPGGGTPSHLMMDLAGSYLSRTDLGAESPWAFNPGVTEQPLLSCRKSFHIFMTDGGWNSQATLTVNHLDTSGDGRTRIVRGGNADNTQTTLPDGTVYNPTSAQTRLYRDSWGTNNLSTLSDLAFYYWSRDLQPQAAMPNNVRPSPAQQWPRQNFGTQSTPAELDAYWNPRNNPATWQHMVNYTIGFNSAASWTGSPITTGRTALVRQSVTGVVTSSASGAELPTNYFNSSRNQVRYSRTDTSAPRGWYMDLPVARERVLSNPSIQDGEKVVVMTTTPPQGSAEETCTATVAVNRSWRNVLNMITGQPPRDRTFGNTDSTMNTADTSRHELESDEYASVYTREEDQDLISLGRNGPTKQTLLTTKRSGKRADWLEIQ